MRDFDSAFPIADAEIMEATSITLLQSAKSGSSEAWRRIDAIYRPFLRDWYRFRRIPEHFAEDLTQQVMLVLLREIPKFEHSGRAGAFRLWLRRTAVFEEKTFWKRRCNGEKASGGSEFQNTIEQLEDENNDLALHWDKQHDRFVLRRLHCLTEIGDLPYGHIISPALHNPGGAELGEDTAT